MISKVTRTLRHALVKKLAPQIWKIAHDTIHSALFVDSYPKPSTLYVKKLFGKRLVNCVEIGVSEGLNAESILKVLNVDTFYLIDNYGSYIDRGRRFDMASIQPLMFSRLAMFDANKIRFIKKTSDEAVAEVPFGLDFIYIDGNHEYEQVLRDIENYSKKLREGGVLAGHDFTGDYLSVVRAVMEFASQNDYELMTEKADWWFII